MQHNTNSVSEHNAQKQGEKVICYKHMPHTPSWGTGREYNDGECSEKGNNQSNIK